MNKILILLFVFILCLPFSLANFNYSELGNPDGLYQQGLSQFNEALVFDLEDDGTSRNLGLGIKTPLVQDLEGDGTSEIIVLDSANIFIYQGTSLIPNDSIAIPTGSFFSNMIVFDIDGDGLQEIIIGDSEATETLYIFEFNGTSFHQQNNLSVASATHTTGEFLIKCGTTEDCLIAYAHTIQSVAGATLVYARTFNSTAIGTETLIITSNNAEAMCFPKIPNMVYADFDTDGDNEFVFTIGSFGGGVATEDVYLESIRTNQSGGVIVEELGQQIITSDFVTTGAGTSCQNDLGKYLTSPAVFDFIVGGNEEAVFGYSEDVDEFIIVAYSPAGAELDSYPATGFGQADGEIVSNLVVGNFFSDTGDVDVCVLGYDDTDLRIDLLCASEQSGSATEHREHILDFGSGSNLTSIYDRHDALIHGVQANGIGIDEIISTIGTLELDWSSTCLVTAGCLDLIWSNPVVNGTVISVDIDEVGWEDLVVLAPTRIWFLSDTFIFSGADIIEEETIINPCLEATWKVSDANDDNITRNVQILMEVRDADGDQVMARSILYYGEIGNSTADWSPLVNSGVPITNSHDINATTSSSILRIEANDTSNPTDIDVIEAVFSVSTTGVEFGDCTSALTPEEEDVLTAEEQAFQENNSITNTIEELKGAVNINVTNQVIWLVIMAFVGGTIAYAGFKVAQDNEVAVLATVGIVEFILFLLGIALGYLSVIHLWIMIIIAVGILSFRMRQIAVGG